MASSRVAAIEAIEFDSATLTGIGDFDVFCAALPEPCFLIRIINASDTLVGVSYDGAVVNDYIHTLDTLHLYFPVDGLGPNRKALMNKGRTIYLSGAAGIGNIYLAGYYMQP